MPFPYTFPFPFQDKRDSKYSDGNYGATDKSPISAEYEGTVDKSPASSEYSDTVEKSPESDEYSSTQEKSPTSDEYGSMVNRSPTSMEYIETTDFPYEFGFTFPDERDSRYREISTYGNVINKSGLDDEYDTTQTRSGWSSY